MQCEAASQDPDFSTWPWKSHKIAKDPVKEDLHSDGQSNKYTFKDGEKTVEVTQSLEEKNGLQNVKTTFNISDKAGTAKEYISNTPLPGGSNLGEAFEEFKAKMSSNTPSFQDLKSLPFVRSLPDFEFDASSWKKYMPNAPMWMNSAMQLYNQLTFGDGSIADAVRKSSTDPSVHPEIEWDAKVRIGDELCHSELAYKRNRQREIKAAFAKYIGVDESEVNAEDIPTVSMAGSGGGYRAMVATTGYLAAAKEAGLFDVTTYMSGVSGSSWAMMQYFALADRSFEKLIQHFKDRLSISFMDIGTLIDQLQKPNLDKYILSGLFLKNEAGVDKSLVDFFGTLLTARLLVPHDDGKLDEKALKISQIRRWIDDGHEPMPIFSAVRHQRAQAKDQESYFQTFAFTPHEVGCEEYGAWIPMWGFGREYDNGVNVTRGPEVHSGLLLGVYGSAFCATLAHYYAEVKPLLPPGTIKTRIESYIDGYEKEMAGIHPIPPAEFNNFMRNLKDLPSDAPRAIIKNKTIDLADAGMHLNVDLNSLLRRKSDVLIVFDASSDFAETPWPGEAAGYAKQRGINGWPMEMSGRPDAPPPSSEAEPSHHDTVENDTKQDRQERAQPGRIDKENLSLVNVWTGTSELTETSDPPPSNSDKTKVEGGISVVYFPLMANPKVEGIDPHKDEFTSTWNFVYKPDQVDKLVDLAKANFKEGEDQVREVIKDAWQRKKAWRECHSQ